MKLTTERIYDPPAAPGFRVLVDRLWPRGISKQRAAIDYWAKEIAPSNELRKWFNHKEERYGEFVERYRQELDNNAAISDFIDLLREKSEVVLVYSAKNIKYNQAVALLDYLEHKTQT